MNAVQKRKAKKFAYRTSMRKKIVFIKDVCLDGMFSDEIAGFDYLGRSYHHMTNFNQCLRKTYRMALMTYPGNRGQFGLSDTTIAGNFEEGHCYDAPDMGALFVTGNFPRSDFWEHFRRVEDQLTRYTRRELKARPTLNNNDWMRTMRCPPM